YEVLLSLFARAADHSGGRQFPHHYASKRLGIYTISSVIAAHLPHAAGAAYALKFRKEHGRAVLTTFGDGCTSEGEWHESLNFAAVHKLPIVFLCENNEWAISTPLEHQMGQPDIYKRAEGYGMPGAVVNGFDPIACYAATKEALDRARRGGGPTLIEALTYRIGDHTTSDDATRYRDSADVEAWRARDPLERYRRWLLSAGHVDEAGVTELEDEAEAWVRDVCSRLTALGTPPREELYAFAFADPPPNARPDADA
ncbi:MAG: thiamine pyrophosphate-dependent dehydrogenase E1 component subunit alpha, partial [Actinomycetota bacterium]